jgi:hypothetical protein
MPGCLPAAQVEFIQGGKVFMLDRINGFACFFDSIQDGLKQATACVMVRNGLLGIRHHTL